MYYLTGGEVLHLRQAFKNKIKKSIIKTQIQYLIMLKGFKQLGKYG